ncbi:MAG TPA: aminopeptidase P N-terminal domain-containing protein [Cyclobacteriaceae bacterium]|nr:aminopeptidase P N-terminal domain-containing protein [Cyclobacteriaceae bacterium]
MEKAKITFWKKSSPRARVMYSYVFLPCLLLFSLSAFDNFAQTVDLPDDFLDKDFHRERREKLKEKLPANSVAVFFSNPVRNRANDVDYLYHQDPDFYYLTGYREPNAVLLVFKEPQTAANGTRYDEIIFVQPRNPDREKWDGRRLGENQVRSLLGLEQAFNNSEFKKYDPDFSKFSEVLFFDFKNDVRDDPADSADLYDIIREFKVKSGYPTQEGLRITTLEGSRNNLNTKGLATIMTELRGVKTKEELELIRKAVSISCIGQVEVMKAIKPGMSEREVQGIHEFVFKKFQAEDIGYSSIVGGGHNGCILHYIDNYKPSLDQKELILMDLGAEYHGYTADITRTIPVSGKFSRAQRQIYEVVLEAQEAAMDICKEGTSFAELNKATQDVVNKGLTKLGIIPSVDAKHKYYPHGCCHHIGLDVHDRGARENLKENMVITIEPGIYIDEGSDCDPKWWGIGVRIEDDYLIQKDGCEHLSTLAPRDPDEIEALMKQPSPLDDFVLPELEEKEMRN